MGERDWLYENDEVLATIRRYEDMMKKKEHYFFDVHEFEEIINYYIDVNNVSFAVSAAEYAYRMHPTSTAIKLKIARLLVDNGKAAESIEILDILEKIEESDYEVFMLKGMALSILGQESLAKQYFDKAIYLSHHEYRHELFYEIGRSFLQQNNYTAAIKYLNEVQKLDSLNIQVLFDLAYCYEHLDQVTLSIEFYEKYLAEDPFSDHSWFNLGNLYNKVQNFEKAIEAYDYALAINTSYGSAYFNKANIFSFLERYDEALISYLEFLQMEDNHIMAHCYIADCYEKLLRYEEASLFFQKALILDPACADGWYGKGVVSMHLEQYEDSQKYLLHALELNNDNLEYLYALGLVYMRQNDLKNSLNLFKQVTELDPSDCEGWLHYSELLLMANRVDEAIKILNQAHLYNFNDAYINLRLASYLFIQGKMSQAYTYLEKALSLDKECIEELYEFYPEAILDDTTNKIIKKYLNLQ